MVRMERMGQEGPAEPAETKPSKANKYAKEPKPAPKESKLVLKRRAKAAAHLEKQAEKYQSAATGGSDTHQPLARQLSDGFGEQYVGSQGAEDSDCLVHAVNGFLNHDELDDKLRDKLAETINIAELISQAHSGYRGSGDLSRSFGGYGDISRSRQIQSQANYLRTEYILGQRPRGLLLTAMAGQGGRAQYQQPSRRGLSARCHEPT